ncbi:colanic acid biosynthesis acetyltransferase WcaF [Lutibacter sp. HS1-25]|uniref:WcaF family extracellular polysaccharide biosynthesis acetyltransferase n=1 Tax=Lutibacter sp. HS1-25 TaxID=2485000 RepID=UPI001013687F|nr:WcaF family extracellular polysaccharide biosynthesis acetyltransferase [Lutibacter sp. HS1-25]RXP45398.1 colanic acid biosynthesis acetyltransferase WcaF [Lutibacter sp. HS1-25]
MSKVIIASYNNAWYQPGGRFKILLWYFINALFFINPLNPISSVKVILLRLFGAKVGTGVHIKPSVNIKYPWLLEIGNNVWIGEHVWIDNLAKVTIEDNVCISQGAMLLCGNHNYKKSTFDLTVKEIKLEAGAWLGAKSVVCPGVTVKSHAILSVASIAVRDLEAYTIYQGNPAQKIRERKIEVS